MVIFSNIYFKFKNELRLIEDSSMASKIVKTVIFLIVIALLVGTLILSIQYFIKNSPLVTAEKETVTVVDKTAVKGLFRPPAYYVKVDANSKNSDTLFDGLINRVTSKQMRSLEVGDSIDGYILDNARFLTTYDLVVDGMLFLFGIFVLFILIVGLVVGFIFSLLPRKENKKRNVKKNNKKESKEESKLPSIFKWLFLVVLSVIIIIFSFQFLVNSIHKIIPVGQTTTDALIIDKYSEREWQFVPAPIFVDQVVDALFEFTLSYEDESGETYKIVKAVTAHTFENYDISDTIPISYRNSNPLDVFIRNTTFMDAIQAIRYWELGIYLFTVVAAILVVVFWVVNKFKRKKNRVR